MITLIVFQDLVKDLKSELGGNLENVVLAMMEPHETFDARSLRSAMKVCTYVCLCTCTCVCVCSVCVCV